MTAAADGSERAVRELLRAGIGKRIDLGNAFRVVVICAEYVADLEYGMMHVGEDSHELWIDGSTEPGQDGDAYALVDEDTLKRTKKTKAKVGRKKAKTDEAPPEVLNTPRTRAAAARDAIAIAAAEAIVPAQVAAAQAGTRRSPTQSAMDVQPPEAPATLDVQPPKKFTPRKKQLTTKVRKESPVKTKKAASKVKKDSK
ncbi:uncharacterized protein C2845_PM08G09710 [Panicum miliaceum]|uniref:Uncharacterized protein n=1 Tax=Panicum miliaceum TaxID=4540 RepID=A0A3L6R5T1_PANMI|nr:uncharacterized protein C2845_PM08G09710 [Panicum miliaceum]